nr:unnamed protein product [Callosobruchus analis]
MLIMMIRMQKPLYLTIGKFFPLTLETFVQVSVRRATIIIKANYPSI